jgi:CRISPR-associated protein Csb1
MDRAAYAGDLNQLFIDPQVVAVVARQRLRPADGPGQPFFPPTYLGANDAPTYCISPLGGEHNLCVVDSVQSQANRIEAAFLAAPYRELVRPVAVSATLADGSTRTLDVLEMGHRLADAALAFSDLDETVHAALRAYAAGGPDEIARLSPMSLLCGLWDSRRSQLKIPRAFSASITARDVMPLRRMATFTGSFWSKELGLEGGTRSVEGLDAVPAKEALGGVVAAGEIVRMATLNLVALRQNVRLDLTGTGPAPTPGAAARYIHALGLVALSLPIESFLRQGCLLVDDEADAHAAVQLHVVLRRGAEQTLTLTHEAALGLAREAAQRFGVPALAPLLGTFQKDRLAEKTPAGGKSGGAKAAKAGKDK